MPENETPQEDQTSPQKPVKTTFNERELEYFRQIILNKRSKAAEDAERLRYQLKESREQTEFDPSSRSNMEDGDADAVELEKLYLLIARQTKFINELDRALDRIENKTYGMCKVTGKPISKERLEAVPHTQLSIEAKNKIRR